MSPLSVVAFSGSLRKGSFNTALARAAQSLAPAGMTITLLDIGSLPLFNQDLEAALPASVQALKAAVESAQAVLFVTPEYNYSISGVLKNAIDWLSRPYGKNSLDGKPMAIIGASGGLFGTARAQYHLRQMLVCLNGHVLNRPEVMVGAAQEKFSADGKLTDEATAQKVREFLAALAAWAERLRP